MIDKIPSSITAISKPLKYAGLVLFLLLWNNAVQTHKISKYRSDIESGRTKYYPHGWFIDRWHANPTGVLKLWNQVCAESWEHRWDYYRVSYSQSLRKYGINKVTEEVYWVKSGCSLEQKKSIAWLIYKQVSDKFEQESEWVIDYISGTAYSMEDLPSNTIWFMRAVEWFSKDEIEEILWWESDSAKNLEHYIKTDQLKNKTRQPLIYDRTSQNINNQDFPSIIDSKIDQYEKGQYNLFSEGYLVKE